MPTSRDLFAGSMFALCRISFISMNYVDNEHRCALRYGPNLDPANKALDVGLWFNNLLQSPAHRLGCNPSFLLCLSKVLSLIGHALLADYSAPPNTVELSAY